mmetsp:Transcript_15917/g.43082  ORF Transcript_15917/g.43082 Transcript_15917/m.43082 type:complete len:241 (-) Transcript_15917:1386-2108(-)
MFPDKVVVNGPKFSITYNTTFKVLTNLRANEKYVLVQRGCPTPTLPDGFVAKAVVQVPVARVSITSVTDSKWIELIGERNSLIGMPGIYTTSPCVNKRYDLGFTVDMSKVSYNSTLSQYQMSSNPKMLTGTYASVLSTPVGPPHPLPHHARPAVSTEMLTLPALRCSSMWCSRAHAARPPGCPSSSPAPPTNSPTNWSPSGASSSRPSTTRRLPLTPSSATSRRAGTARGEAGEGSVEGG